MKELPYIYLPHDTQNLVEGQSVPVALLPGSRLLVILFRAPQHQFHLLPHHWDRDYPSQHHSLQCSR